MRSARPSRLAAAGLVLAGILAMSCGRPSDENSIRALLKDASSLAEKRDLAGLMELFAADYRDFQGRGVAATRLLIADYLDRYHGLVVHLLGVRLGEIGSEGTASLECEIVLSHGAAEVLRRLVRVAGEYYHFRMEVRRTAPGEWRFASAAWESVGLDELFPESLRILRELFPGL
jgi:hypothetical protein